MMYCVLSIYLSVYIFDIYCCVVGTGMTSTGILLNTEGENACFKMQFVNTAVIRDEPFTLIPPGYGKGDKTRLTFLSICRCDSAFIYVCVFYLHFLGYIYLPDFYLYLYLFIYLVLFILFILFHIYCCVVLSVLPRREAGQNMYFIYLSVYLFNVIYNRLLFVGVLQKSV